MYVCLVLHLEHCKNWSTNGSLHSQRNATYRGSWRKRRGERLAIEVIRGAYYKPNRRVGTAFIWSNSCVSFLLAADKHPSLLLSSVISMSAFWWVIHLRNLGEWLWPCVYRPCWPDCRDFKILFLIPASKNS